VLVAEKRSAFRALHQRGCFVLPNPWDVGSAKMLAAMGFAALASSSAGYAWTTGRRDYAVTRDDVLDHLHALCGAVDVPINADFESGFAEDPDEVAANALLAVDTGVAGLSIEDRAFTNPERLLGVSEAARRIAVVRATLDATSPDVVLVARTELLLLQPEALSDAIEKLVAFAAAGADCLFAPGVSKPEEIAAMVKAVAPKPLNVLVARPGLTLRELEDLGVRRVSVGGALARVAWGAVLSAAEQMKAGSFEGLANAAPGAQMNGLFRPGGLPSTFPSTAKTD
jgi:2-methylisocitrate lyase-like PEP mutase family enzyme